MRFPGFVGPTYKTASPNVDAERCINFYPEKNEMGRGKEQEPYSLRSTPGLTTLVTLASGQPVRATYTASNGLLFAVCGNKFYYVDSSFVAHEKGTLGTSTGVVSMIDNGLQIFIVDGSTTGYSYTLGSATFADITDTDFPGADTVTYQDGYFIFNKIDSGQFMLTGLNDITVDALDFATSEGNPDQVVAVLSNYRSLWVFNEVSTEVFYDSGDALFPFARIEGAFIEIGLGAKFSVAKMNNAVFWLGKNDKGSGIIYKAQGYTPQRISNHSVESAIQSYSDVSDARAFCYQQGGHDFYVLNFPSAQTTWVYDDTTGLWHERVYINQGVIERHRADCHALAYGKHVVGDYANGKLYELTPTAYSDDGTEIMRRRVTTHISASGSYVTHASFELDIEAGVGLDGTGQGTDPKVMLRFSDDGGHSWSNEKKTDIGKIGKRKNRSIWRRLGIARDRVYEITISDPVPVTIMGANIDLEANSA